MSFVFSVNTAEEMRQEIVRFLEHLANHHRDNEKIFKTKHKMQLEREKAFVLQAAADDIKWAVLNGKGE